MKKLLLLFAMLCGLSSIALSQNNVIYYTSTNGEVVRPKGSASFGATIISNTYKNDKGVITFDDNVTEIGNKAFWSCQSLTSITIPESVTKIGEGAFYNCKSLTSITIPESVTEIGEEAFSFCESLKSITIPQGVTKIGNYAFWDCESLAKFNGKFASRDSRCLIVNGVLHSFAPAGLTEYSIPEGVTEIGDWAFSYCKSLTSITIPESVTEIGGKAFYYCESLKSITIPESVIEIGEEAFAGCESLAKFNGKFASRDSRYLIINGVLKAFAPAGLTKYTIPNGVTEIEKGAFEGCSSLKSITIPDSVTEIGSSAFYNCESLTSVYCKPTTPPAGGNYMFYYNAFGSKIYVPRKSVNAYKKAAYWSDYASAFVGYDFSATPSATTTKPSGTSIPNNQIWYTSTDGKVVEPYDADCFGATIISNTYKNGKGVITFDDNVTEIGKYAFWDCESLKSITIPESVTKIGNCAFYNCESLTSITIPESVTKIGEGAFSFCESLTSVYCKPTTPPAGGYYMFINNASGRKIYVPRGSVQAYKRDWSDYADAIVGFDF